MNTIIPSASPPSEVTDAVLIGSNEMPAEAIKTNGIDFNDFQDKTLTADDLFEGMKHMGFQATSLGDAVRIINEMLSWHDPEDPSAKTTIFLGYTSNLVSSGLRSVIRYLVQHSLVAAVVTTAGGVEEDIIKCLHPTYLSSFHAPGATLRQQGHNRIGNLVVPNNNYCSFEDWLIPVLNSMVEEQEAKRGHASADDDCDNAEGPDFTWTPSTVIARLGKAIASHPRREESILYWAWKNSIPIFCPALTDGSLGDMLYFHTYKISPRKLSIDIVQDVRRINTIAVQAKKTGMIILGGGIVKHHIANANLMRNGADYAVYINTAQEFDGSDAGARPDEAVSWGKIKMNAPSVKLYAEATLVFPLIVSQTFLKVVQKQREST